MASGDGRSTLSTARSTIYHWRPPMSAEAQLQYEGRVHNRQAVIALAAGVLVIAGSIVGLVGPHAKVNELTLGLITDHKRGYLDVISGVLDALFQIATAVTLVFLYRCSKARRPEAPTFMPVLAVVGAALSAICAIVNPIVLHSKVNTFVTTGAQTYDEASRLTGGSGLLALQIGAQVGALLLALGVVLIALQAMRVGLLPRPLGYVGIFAGVLILFPIIVVPVVQMGWLLAVGYLISGRWAGGMPPAWRTGNAEPWPSSNETRARRAAAAEEARAKRAAGKRGGGAGKRGGAAGKRGSPGAERGAAATVSTADAPAIDGDASEPQQPERTRAGTPKRKRKRRN
jgi:hypothetical protein